MVHLVFMALLTPNSRFRSFFTTKWEEVYSHALLSSSFFSDILSSASATTVTKNDSLVWAISIQLWANRGQHHSLFRSPALPPAWAHHPWAQAGTTPTSGTAHCWVSHPPVKDSKPSFFWVTSGNQCIKRGCVFFANREGSEEHYWIMLIKFSLLSLHL